jgi:hypothetical protein
LVIYSIRTACRFGIGKRLLFPGTGRYPNTMGARACGVGGRNTFALGLRDLPGPAAEPWPLRSFSRSFPSLLSWRPHRGERDLRFPVSPRVDIRLPGVRGPRHSLALLRHNRFLPSTLADFRSRRSPHSISNLELGQACARFLPPARASLGGILDGSRGGLFTSPDKIRLFVKFAYAFLQFIYRRSVSPTNYSRTPLPLLSISGKTQGLPRRDRL